MYYWLLSYETINYLFFYERIYHVQFNHPSIPICCIVTHDNLICHYLIMLSHCNYPCNMPKIMTDLMALNTYTFPHTYAHTHTYTHTHTHMHRKSTDIHHHTHSLTLPLLPSSEAESCWLPCQYIVYCNIMLITRDNASKQMGEHDWLGPDWWRVTASRPRRPAQSITAGNQQEKDHDDGV